MKHLLTLSGILTLLFIQGVNGSQTKERKEPSSDLQTFIDVWAQTSFDKDSYIKDKNISLLNIAWSITMDALAIVRDISKREGIDDRTVYSLYKKRYQDYAEGKMLSEILLQPESLVPPIALNDQEIQRTPTSSDQIPVFIEPEDETPLLLIPEEAPEIQVSSNPESDED